MSGRESRIYSIQITDGAVYEFHGTQYRANHESTEASTPMPTPVTLVSFQRHPRAQVDDEPSMFLDSAGALTSDTGAYLGDYDELREIKR